MTASRGLNWTALGVIAALWLSATAHAQPADRLPPDIIAKNGSWTDAERDTVESFVDRQIANLLVPEEPVMTAARDALKSAFGVAGATERFLAQYSEAIAERIGPAVESEELQPRINAMIVLETPTHADAIEPLEQGLQDSSAGVRYPAAKGMANLLSSGVLDRQQQGRVLELLVQLVDREDEPYNLTPLLRALIQAGDLGQALEALNRRVDWHVARPDSPYDAEADALQEIFGQLFADRNRPADVAHQLARGAARYMLLAAQQLNQGAVRRDNWRSHLEIIRRADAMLRWAASEYRPGQRPPEDINVFIIQRNLGRIEQVAQSWIEFLTGPPFNFTAEQLTVNEEAVEE